jgi:GH18 family chitinase
VSITKQYIANDADGQTPVAAGWTHHWDDKRLSSYLWNAETAEMLTYENPKSFTEKTKKLAAYTDDEERHLLGVKIYHVAGDTDDGVLVNAVRKAWPKK